MKTLYCLLMGLLVSLPLWSEEPKDNLSADEIRQISDERTVVTIISSDGKEKEGKILEYDGETVLFQRQEDLQLYRFKLTALALQSQRMIKDNYMTSDYNVPKLQRPLSADQIRKFAAYADTLVLEKLRSERQVPTRAVDDYTFMRRAYLKIIGRIPNKAEIDEFKKDMRGNKLKLINKLLDTEGYVSHQLNYFSDILRIQDKLNNTNINSGFRYREFVREEIRKNTPYDEFVQKLIAAEGAYFEEGNEAIGFYLRDRGMPLDNLANTVQVFLGTRLECAMCHDHPFDKWTQKQFYEMSAFTDGVSRVQYKDNMKVVSEFNRLVRADGTEDARVLNSYRNYIRDIIGYGLSDLGKGNIKLTKEFMEDDAKPGDVLQAKAIFAPPLEIEKEQKLPESRKQFAEWMTSEANPRFTTVIVNRLWKRAFGIGLIEPVDDMNDNTESSNPKLLGYLEKIMASVDYDVKEFMRVLYSMDLFTRESVKDDYESLETFYFAGPPLQRMTGEQIWDSLVTLVYNDIDSPKRVPPNYDEKYKLVYDRYVDKTAKEIYDELKAYLAETEKPSRNLAEVVVSLHEKEYPNKKIADRDLLRSSYVGYPARGGHLIRQFGGSDKQLIENSNFEATTPQVLNMLNGFVEKRIINNKNADFMKQMAEENRESGKIEDIFMSILNRKPNPKEMKLLKKYIDKPNGAKHIAWILMNSHEFIFIR
tara:strand:+ start:87958 stop:90075 length:2118 start_codon:yes stop_codon:yes gene_type:complete